MKTVILVFLLLGSALTIFAGSPATEIKSNPGFDKIKSLEGSWTGKDDEGKIVTLEYKIVSAGTALMESLNMEDHPDAMVTMYHIDKDKLMMTHYCSMGNQPRMKAGKMSDNGSTISFSMVDATNLASKNDAHMSKLVVMFKDKDHFSQEWTMMQGGKVNHVAKFEFERTK